MVIHLEWEGPRKFTQIGELTNDYIDYGIYQIVYRPSNDSPQLLYIGLANDQTIGSRLGEHKKNKKFEEFSQDSLDIYVGRVISIKKDSDEVWRKKIINAEKLLIYSNRPILNIEFNKTEYVKYCKDLFDDHVLNWGKDDDDASLGLILPESSGARWTHKFWNGDYTPLSM